MKFSDCVIVTKGSCVFFGASFLTYQTVISQWSNTADDLSKLQWSMVIIGSLGSGVLAFSAWLSSAFSNYLKGDSGGTASQQPNQTKAEETKV